MNFTLKHDFFVAKLSIFDTMNLNSVLKVYLEINANALNNLKWVLPHQSQLHSKTKPRKKNTYRFDIAFFDIFSQV